MDFRERARRVLQIEAQAIGALSQRIDDSFTAACRLCLGCRGRVVVTGMGKSGHIGGKIAATLASTGTPAFFVHPGEASHGDLGMITGEDLVIAISRSGETAEIITILPLLKRLGVGLITITEKATSTLADNSTVVLDLGIQEEACTLNLAPTTSTTAALAMGDALAVALLECRGFTREDFARSHPGGSLGKRLLLKVEDLMHTGDRVPRIRDDAPLAAGLLEMTRKGFGMTAVIDPEGKLTGVFTDGDLRRTLAGTVDAQKTRMSEVMTKGCKTIGPDALATEAVRLMDQHKITALLVVDHNQRLTGALNVHDLMRAGVM